MKESDNEEIIDTGRVSSEGDFDYEIQDDIDTDYRKTLNFEVVDNNLNSYGLKKNNDGTYDVEESYHNKKYIMDYIWMGLICQADRYTKLKQKNQLPLFTVMDCRNTCIVLLNGRMNALAMSKRKNFKEYKECDFLRKALANGWAPTDIMLLSEFYEAYDKDTVESSRTVADNIIKSITGVQLENINTRMQILVDMSSYSSLIREDGKETKLDSLINLSMEEAPLPTEIATDENYASFFKKNGYLNPNQQMKHGSPSENYLDLLSSATMYMNLSEKQKQRIRSKSDYVMAKLNDEELEKFNITTGHTHNKITKSNRNALKEVFGDEIYDDIDEMHKGSAEDRKVTIYHSLGNKYLQKGEEVLEIDFAGSGFKEARREYNGQHGKKFTDGTRNDQDSITLQYGELVNKPNSQKKYSHLRAKDTLVELNNGVTMKKTRYSIAGPTPDLLFKPGAFNLGEYSIENTREYGRNFAAKFLNPIFNKALQDGLSAKEMKDIHIHLTGHSRGAVASGESVKLMNKWVKEYERTHLGATNFSDRVKYKQILRDPVPGIFTKWFHGEVDLRKVKNLDTTVFCSMAQEHFDINFPLQNVRGAQRIIIGTTDHGMELGSTDSSQVLTKGDGKAHLAGFYDAETGEYFRGSGLTEIPDGVYIADDNYNLIRITSYSQLAKVIDAVYDGKSKQGRVNTIHKMVRNWFLDNELKMSFLDDETYEKAKVKNDETVNKILASDNKRLADIKAQLTRLNELKANGILTDDLFIEQNNRIIKACREYMQKTSIPTSRADSTYRMDLVSDLLSFCMKENNQYRAEIAKRNHEPENELDAKMRKQKERMESKPGALDRKYANETKRLERDEKIFRSMKETAKSCEDTIKLLQDTRKNKTPSNAYEAFINTLKEGTRLGEQTSVDQYKKFLKMLIKVSENYTDIKTSYGDPSSKDGQLRVKMSEGLSRYGHNTLVWLNSKSTYMSDRDRPIGEVINQRKANLQDYKNKGAKMPVEDKTEIKKNSNKKVVKKVNKSLKK